MNKMYIISLWTLLLFACSAGQRMEVMEMEDGTWKLRLADAELTIDPANGAKDVSLRLGDTEFLTGPEVRKEYHGSSLWLAPQMKFWPPSTALDQGIYKAESFPGGVRFKSDLDEAHALSYMKEIKADADRRAFIHRYLIRNESDEEIALSAWEVSRHPKAGISLFPMGDTSATGTRFLDPSIPMILDKGMVWHPYAPGMKGHPGKGSKASIDGKDGWVAYVLGGHALVKIFSDVTPDRTAPGHKDVEIYVDSGHDYIEVELVSAYHRLQAGEALDWTVEWRIVELPADLEATPGNGLLLEYLLGALEKNYSSKTETK